MYRVEAAVCADGSSPALQFLTDLKNGSWADDPDYPDAPATDSVRRDEQIRDYWSIIALIKYLADTGEPKYGRSVGYLGDGMWELKFGSRRLTFFDTPGDGTFTAKPRIQDLGQRDANSNWWFPDFDDVIRLGHAFPKLGEKSGQFNIDSANAVREEDLRHDREE